MRRWRGHAARTGAYNMARKNWLGHRSRAANGAMPLIRLSMGELSPD